MVNVTLAASAAATLVRTTYDYVVVGGGNILVLSLDFLPHSSEFTGTAGLAVASRYALSLVFKPSDSFSLLYEDLLRTQE